MSQPDLDEVSVCEFCGMPILDEGWTAVTLEDVAAVRLAGAPGPDGELVFTPIGERADEPNQVVTEVLDIAERHRELLASDIPTIDSVAVPVALREK